MEGFFFAVAAAVRWEMDSSTLEERNLKSEKKDGFFRGRGREDLLPLKEESCFRSWGYGLLILSLSLLLPHPSRGKPPEGFFCGRGLLLSDGRG